MDTIKPKRKYTRKNKNEVNDKDNLKNDVKLTNVKNLYPDVDKLPEELKLKIVKILHGEFE